jgi:hypothetical protein
MIRQTLCAVALAALSLRARLASAEEAGPPEVQTRPAATEPAPVHLMALTAPARLADAPIAGSTWAGYDGAIEGPRVTVSVEAALVRRLAIVVGADSSSDANGQFAVRPLIALRLQVLEQGAAGVDAAAAVTYRQDRFDADGGFIQGTIALGRRLDRLLLGLNLTYGIDPEGDDHEGEVCAAARVEATPSFYLGVDGRYRHDLGSTDPNRAERDRSDSELLAGPTASYVHGRWAVMLEAGISRVVTISTHTAPVALAGYAATF